MAIQNKTQYAILGILSISSGSGYDIKKYCDTVISNVWHENFGHIYPVLKSMLFEGLIKRKEGDESSRRKEYEITAKGKEKFLNWLIEPTQYAPVRSEFMLKFLFSNHLPKENLIKMIEDYKEKHQIKYQELLTMENDLKQGIPALSPDREIYLAATLKYGILSTEAAIKWCDEVIAML